MIYCLQFKIDFIDKLLEICTNIRRVTLLTNAKKKKPRKIGFICEFNKQNHI